MYFGEVNADMSSKIGLFLSLVKNTECCVFLITFVSL